jgi:hypothetical protein
LFCFFTFEGLYLLGYNAVLSVESKPTFRRLISPPSSGQNNNPSKKPTSACYLLYAGFLLGIFFDPEDRGDMFLLNVG